jgi:predicted metal-dependent hydrolase
MGLFGPRYADGQTLEVAGSPVRLRVSARARRISLRVDRAKREAVAIAPSARHLSDAVAFARSRGDWISQRLAELSPPVPALAPGDTVVVLNRKWRLRCDGRRPKLIEPAAGEERILAGCGAGAVDDQLVVRAIRREAQRVFEGWAEAHCRTLGVVRPPISLTDARTRWGSCTPPRSGSIGSIRLSWRLALAPSEVADYVVAHECAHLLEANHGPRFWALVRRLVGDERPYRRWLRSEGGGLHTVLAKAG